MRRFGLDWRPILRRYLVTFAIRCVLGSRRVSAERKALAVGLGVPPIVAILLGLELTWLLTGRGRRLRHALAYDVVVVVPHPRQLPAVFAEQIAGLRAKHAEASAG